MHEGENKIIQRPPRIYLDTNHLVYIAKVRKGQKLPQGQSEGDYRQLDEYIKSYCGLIFNPAAPMDWIDNKATKQRASSLAAVIDSAKLKYIMPETDGLVYTYEVLKQCQAQDSSIRVPDLPPIPQKISNNSTIRSPLGILINQVPDYLDKELREKIPKDIQFPTEEIFLTALQWMDELFKRKQKYPEMYQKRKEYFKASLSEDINRKDEYFNNPQHYRKAWLKRFLKIGRILKAFNPEIDIDGILDKIDATKCSAVRLYWAVREKRMLSGNPPNDNDVDDYMYIPIVPYADIVLIEKELKGYIIQVDKNLKSKVFSKASDALAALENQKFSY